jgi:hypothetical protein
MCDAPGLALIQSSVSIHATCLLWTTIHLLDLLHSNFQLRLRVNLI